VEHLRSEHSIPTSRQQEGMTVYRPSLVLLDVRLTECTKLFCERSKQNDFSRFAPWLVLCQILFDGFMLRGMGALRAPIPLNINLTEHYQSVNQASNQADIKLKSF
jgi:hypothetical protein